ncbi:hypothetical protein PIB30_092758 [Stylosanthes scabra]|uniref:Sulfotransferase n=1 Tax=Stylosanthes scabra TaxID=79078 RepID=A0ABU6UUE9_9FABA|nr:hypothetical protein [Stylosanthes scabra]
MGRDADGIWFRFASSVVFQMQPVNTLEELKSVILRNMGAVGSTLVRRVAYRLLNLFPPNQFKFKIFWVDSDAHVRAMFELHRRYGSRDVMELLTEMQQRFDKLIPWWARAQCYNRSAHTVCEPRGEAGFSASSPKPHTRFVIRGQPFSDVKPGGYGRGA